MALIKDVYSRDFYKSFGKVAEEVVPGFKTREFIAEIFTRGFDDLEWKQRMQLTTSALHRFMPQAFPQAAGLILEMIPRIRAAQGHTSSFPYLFLADYVEQYGKEHLEPAMESIHGITSFISCEFAVRPFLHRYGDEAMRYMVRWAGDSDHHVRRLASEGSRPRLPWGMALGHLKKDPSPIFPVLEQLKKDPSEYVRRSVANNLNDIGKDHPQVLISVAHRWKGIGRHTDGIIKHALRNLLKQGHPEIMAFYGLDADDVGITDFRLSQSTVSAGSYLPFEFTVENLKNREQYIRLEYAVYFLRNNGTHGKKVFKISERYYSPSERSKVIRRQSFRPITTRTYYPGTHYLSVLYNGKESEKLQFELISDRSGS